MKQRFQVGSDSDSLELLLDTLCNVFGGIVLIACLLAILPRQEMESPLLPAESASTEMLERRLIAGREEMTRLESEIARHKNSLDPKLAELQSRRDSLRRLHDRLRKGLMERQDEETNEAEVRAIVRQGDPEALAEILKELKLRKSESEVIESAAAEKIKFLQRRIASLHDESESLKGGKVQAVRFPRERVSEAFPLPIILRYDCIYPMGIDAELGANPSIGRTAIPGNEGFRAEPIQGRGIRVPVTDRMLSATLKAAIAKGMYATIYLYPDSHHAFGELKEVLSKANVTYGLEFLKPDRVLYFSSEGTLPPEL